MWKEEAMDDHLRFGKGMRASSSDAPPDDTEDTPTPGPTEASVVERAPRKRQGSGLGSRLALEALEEEQRSRAGLRWKIGGTAAGVLALAALLGAKYLSPQKPAEDRPAVATQAPPAEPVPKPEVPVSLPASEEKPAAPAVPAAILQAPEKEPAPGTAPPPAKVAAPATAPPEKPAAVVQRPAVAARLAPKPAVAKPVSDNPYAGTAAPARRVPSSGSGAGDNPY